jgi:hypothetical protein
MLTLAANSSRHAHEDLAFVGFQSRGFADSVQRDFCHALFLEILIFQ